MGVNGEALQLHAVYKKPYFLLQHMHNHWLNLGFTVVDKLDEKVLLIIFHSMGKKYLYLQCRPPSSVHSPLLQ